MPFDTEHACQELGSKTIHHCHDDDQRRHAQHDSGKGDCGNNGDRGLLAARAKITPRHKTLEMGERSGSRGPSSVFTHELAPNRSMTFAIGMVSRSPVARFFNSTSPAATPRGPTITCHGRPIRSALANFAPAR